MLALLSSWFTPFRRSWRVFCWRGWRSTFIATLILWLLVFVWSFYFFVLGSIYSPFPFSRDSFWWNPCANFPFVFVEPHGEGLLILFLEWTCFLCPSSVVSVALLSAIDELNISEYQFDKYFLISSLQYVFVVTSVKERKKMEDYAPVW